MRPYFVQKKNVSQNIWKNPYAPRLEKNCKQNIFSLRVRFFTKSVGFGIFAYIFSNWVVFCNGGFEVTMLPRLSEIIHHDMNSISYLLTTHFQLSSYKCNIQKITIYNILWLSVVILHWNPPLFWEKKNWAWSAEFFYKVFLKKQVVFWKFAKFSLDWTCFAKFWLKRVGFSTGGLFF